MMSEHEDGNNHGFTDNKESVHAQPNGYAPLSTYEEEPRITQSKLGIASFYNRVNQYYHFYCPASSEK